MTTILVNATKWDIRKDLVNYTELVEMANNYSHQDHRLYTIQYSHKQAKGTVTPGQHVKIYNGMVFDVVITGAA